MAQKHPFRIDTVRKLLQLAEEFRVDELSCGGFYIKRGGPGALTETKGKPGVEAGAAAGEGWDITEIDAANEPILDAYRKELA
jgi:hypothetical protein